MVLKLISIFCLFSIISSISPGLYSQNSISNCPASPYPVEISQPDGTRILVQGHGSKEFHYATTIDGYTIIKNEDGLYEYADIDARSNKILSGMMASNPENRTRDEEQFLASREKGIISGLPPQSERLKSERNYLQQQDTLPSFAFPHTGSQKVLVILIKYPDLHNTHTPTDFANLMNQANYNGTGSFKDYFDKVSIGQLDLDSDVFGWYTAANNYIHYGDQNGYTVSQELVSEAIDAAETAGVDFSQYDNDNDDILDG